MTNKAMLIANWTFDPDSDFRCLNGPKVDIELMHQALTHEKFGLFDAANIVKCPEFDRDDMHQAVTEFLSNTTRDDNVLIYYSGHGWKDGRRLRFVARNSKKSKPGTALSTGEIEDALDAENRADSVVLILDCCYAGAFDKGDDTAVLDSALPSVGRWSLYSSLATATSPDGDEGLPSPFTKALTDALLDPNLQPLDGSDELTLDVVYQRMVKTLQPTPKFKADAQGLRSIARRIVVASAPASGGFAELAQLRDGDVTVQWDVQAGHDEAMMLRHLMSTLDLACRRAPEGKAPTYEVGTLDGAWSFMGGSLTRACASEGLLDSLNDHLQKSRQRLTRLQLNCTSSELAYLPWEYMSYAGTEVDFPHGTLAMRRKLVLERLCPPSMMLAPVPDAIDRVALVGMHTADAGRPATEIIPRAETVLRDDLSKLGIKVFPEENTRRYTSSDVPDFPPVVAVLAALRRNSSAGSPGQVELQFGASSEWLPADDLLDWLAEPARGAGTPAPFRAIVIESFAQDPAHDATGATAHLAYLIARLGIGSVAFVCHPSSFRGYRPAGGSPRTFVGCLVSALNAGHSLPRAVYYARLRMQGGFPDKFEARFGVPGLYDMLFAATNAVGDDASTPASSAPNVSAGAASLSGRPASPPTSAGKPQPVTDRQRREDTQHPVVRDDGWG
ncbi:MAG: caspase family protein [Jatrophihabitantaceae bacterium]